MINVAILGSTGSIGLTTLNIIRKNKKKFRIQLLSANTNAKTLFDQAKEFNVKNVILLNKSENKKWFKKFKKNKINIFNNFLIF